jgi:hypothetical protein
VSVDVASLLVGLVKSLIFNTTEDQEKGKGSQAASERRKALKQQQSDEADFREDIDREADLAGDQAMLDEQALAQAREIRKALSEEILRKNIS